MTTILSIVLISIGLLLIWRLFRVSSKYTLIDRPPADAGDIKVREPVPKRPKGKAGAVAIEEPEEDTDTDAYSRRSTG